MGVMHSWELEVVKVLSVDAKIYIYIYIYILQVIKFQ
jgi:hypothetical protein